MRKRNKAVPHPMRGINSSSLSDRAMISRMLRSATKEHRKSINNIFGANRFNPVLNYKPDYLD